MDFNIKPSAFEGRTNYGNDEDDNKMMMEREKTAPKFDTRGTTGN